MACAPCLQRACVDFMFRLPSRGVYAPLFTQEYSSPIGPILLIGSQVSIWGIVLRTTKDAFALPVRSIPCLEALKLELDRYFHSGARLSPSQLDYNLSHLSAFQKRVLFCTQ